MQCVWSLITLVSLVFSSSAVYQWIRLTSLFILIVFWARKTQNIFFWGFKAQFIKSLRMDQLAADRRTNLKCTKYNFTCSRRRNAGSFICKAPHFSTVLNSLSRSYSTFPLSSGTTLNLNWNSCVLMYHIH
jgi:hypothetical protein